MINLINKKENIFNDGIGYVEQWDFSRANMSEENRILAITQVASICYQNPKALGSESLYNRLLAESKGLPSSSFEFVPILFDYCSLSDYYYHSSDMSLAESNALKYGEILNINDIEYILTNYRALLYDVENLSVDKNILQHFNTEEECEIIKQYYKVFRYKVDLPTRSQMVRHRVHWQELSRRYVSGEKLAFDFYQSDKLKDTVSRYVLENKDGHTQTLEFTTQDIINICNNHYETSRKEGVKPQESRRILPQAMYTEIWGGFLPNNLENFYKLRLDKSAQLEIRLVAEAMKELEGVK